MAMATSNDTLAVPLDDLREAVVRLRFGGGELAVRQAPPGILLGGTFEGGVVDRSTTPGRIDLEPLTPGRPLLTWRPMLWDVQLTTEIPVDLRLDTGGNRSTIDLTAVRVRRLELHTGASESNVLLPAAGDSSVHVACGLASVVLRVPDRVAARVRGRIALGATVVDEARFPRTGGGWASVGYDVALDRVDITIEGGLGSVRVE